MPLSSLSDAIRVSNEYISKKKIYQVFLDGISELTHNLKIVKNQFEEKEEDTSKVSITIGLFDIHIGQRVELINPVTNETEISYNKEIASELLEDVFNEAIKVIKIFKKDIGEINIALGGDIIEGDGSIFPGQVHEMALSLNEQIQTATEEISKNIIRLANKFKTIPVNVYSIVGNHGEIRGNAPKKLRDNYDAIIGRYIMFALDKRQEYKKDIKNVKMYVSENSLSIYIKTINGHMIEVIHEMPRNLMSPKSEQIILSRNAGWGVDLIFTGHYHAPVYHEVGKIKIVRSGSLVGPNQYSHKLGIPPGSRQQSIIVSTKDDVAKYIINVKPTVKEEKNDEK